MSKRLVTFTVVNILLLASFLAVVWRDNAREWRRYSHRIEQRNIAALERVDRCETCHANILKTDDICRHKENPHMAHPGDYLVKHPVEKFGCSVCHEGQGLATSARAAHGYVAHWDEPMLKGKYIQGSCGKCHEDTTLAGMEALEGGKKLFNELGCIGCHAVDGWGGNISVEIGEIADKPKEELDFMHIKGERTVANWLFEHFKEPQQVTPAQPELGVMYSSQMPNHNLSDEDANGLTALMLSYTIEKKNMPVSYRMPAKPKETVVYATKEDAGRAVYEKFGCAGCHGKNADAGVKNYNAQGGLVPKLTYVGEGFTAAELKKKIKFGVQPVDKADPNGPVPPLWMQKWGERISDEELDKLVSYLMSLLPKEEKWE